MESKNGEIFETFHRNFREQEKIFQNSKKKIKQI